MKTSVVYRFRLVDGIWICNVVNGIVLDLDYCLESTFPSIYQAMVCDLAKSCRIVWHQSELFAYFDRWHNLLVRSVIYD